MPMNDGLKKCKDRAMKISGTDSKGGYMKEDSKGGYMDEDMVDEKGMYSDEERMKLAEEKTMDFAEFQLLKEQLSTLRVVLD